MSRPKSPGAARPHTGHWLDGVRAVLEADTGDLHELARIAGEDPRTMYVGTDLAGVDVRGQDLRGMVIPSLDRDRVLHDERTRWDDAQDRTDAEQSADTTTPNEER